MMRVLVVDDEGVARRRLVRMLSRMDEVEVAGEAASGDEALQQIASLRPDVVLLDIRMPGMDGLELAGNLPQPAPHVIFTTAYQEYAVQAFERSAVDYLLKPVETDRLQAALDKVRRLDRPFCRPGSLGVASADNHAAFQPAAPEHHRHHIAPVVAAGVAVDARRAAELAHHQNQHVV